MTELDFLNLLLADITARLTLLLTQESFTLDFSDDYQTTP